MARPKKNNDSLTELEQDLLSATQAMLAHVQGNAKDAASCSSPDSVDVKQIRSSMHLTQSEFAKYIGASVHAIRHWENGRRQPDGTARTLLCVLQHNPRAVLDALGAP